MKILLANKFYYPRGGDCIYTIELERLLKRKGHEVAIFSMEYKENLQNEYSKFWVSNVDFNNNNPKNIVKTITRPFYSNEVKNKFQKLLDFFQPDIVHLNNIHSQLSPIIAKIANQNKIPVIWTLHDYKLICPNYLFFQHCKVCEDCINGKYHVVKNKCVKDNLAASVLAYFESIKWDKEILEKITYKFISPSKFLKNKMVEFGFTENKIEQIYNFIPAEKIGKKLNFDGHNKSKYYVYFGRLSYEKGLLTLLDAAVHFQNYKLKIFGTGPLEDKLRNKYSGYPHIKFLGHKTWNELKIELLNAKFFVLPSEWYENNPLSIIEAFLLGLPGIGSEIGGIPELIKNNFTGFLFNPGDVKDLADKISLLFSDKNYNLYIKNAYNFASKFNEENHYRKLIKLYQNAINKKEGNNKWT